MLQSGLLERVHLALLSSLEDPHLLRLAIRALGELDRLAIPESLGKVPAALGALHAPKPVVRVEAHHLRVHAVGQLERAVLGARETPAGVAELEAPRRVRLQTALVGHQVPALRLGFVAVVSGVSYKEGSKGICKWGDLQNDRGAVTGLAVDGQAVGIGAL